jgi:hypothetical protein
MQANAQALSRLACTSSRRDILAQKQSTTKINGAAAQSKPEQI